MSPRRILADGQPYSGNLLAVLDETAPAMGAGIYYVITTAVILEVTQVEIALKDLFADTPGRTRPFHWISEGPAARARMTALIIDHGVVAISLYQSVARNKQKHSRAALLPAIANDLQHEQIDHLIIESGDATTNARDKAVLLDHFRPLGGVPFAYDWRTKQERLLWIADAINGAIHDNFARQNPTALNQLSSAGVIPTGPQYHP